VAGSFDLVFAHNTLLWVRHLAAAVGEAVRVLAPGGALVAVEPDYGGMMEYPDLGLRQLWLNALSRCGAEPLVGRRLPELCERAGLEVWVELAHVPRTAEAEAVGLLEGLDLTDDERRQVATDRQRIASTPDTWSPFLHVPYFLVVAEKR
jgi:SAM-dependent methyltransferase